MADWNIIDAQRQNDTTPPEEKTKRTRLIIVLSAVAVFIVAGLGIGGWYVVDLGTHLGTSIQLHHRLIRQMGMRLQQPGGISETMYHRMAQRYQTAANQASGNERVYCHNVALVLEGLQKVRTAYHVQVQKFIAMGGIGTAHVTSVAQLQQRLDQLKRVSKAEHHWENWIGDMSGRYNAQLRAGHVHTYGVYTASEEKFFAAMSIHSIPTIHDERDLITCYRQILALLKDHFGHWRHDPTNGKVMFSKASPLVAKFNGLIARIHRDAADEHGRLQRRLQKLRNILH